MELLKLKTDAKGGMDYVENAVNYVLDERRVMSKGFGVDPHNIIKALQLEDTSLEQKWVAEAFRRSFIMCPNIKFLTIPERMAATDSLTVR